MSIQRDCFRKWKLKQRAWIRNFSMTFYYSYFPARGLCAKHQIKDDTHKIIVSLTSYGSRLKTVHIAIKSMMNQTIQPDEIVLYLNRVDYENIPKHLATLRKKGLRIIDVGEINIKPHTKYYYAFAEYPDDIIITVDDDEMYERDTIRLLYESYKKFPDCVSAKRCHKIEHDETGKAKKYGEWGYECQNVLTPSRDLFATGVGGVLYPPKLLRKSMFTIDEIQKYCLNADDIMLKFMEIKESVDVVWVNGRRIKPVDIGDTEENGLAKDNVYQNMNDVYIENMEALTGLQL